MDNKIAIIIPSYEPDERLVQTVKSLRENGLYDIIVVDDGSGPKYSKFFEDIFSMGAVLLQHEINKGKGAALKTAFKYMLENTPESIGCVTADSDGQHSPDDIKKIMDAFLISKNALILGSRDFEGEDIPFKSRTGNKITKWVFQHICKINITDTQTGLRGIPMSFMKDCLGLPGDRFEFETAMLLLAKENDVPIEEVRIQTIYDSVEHHSTHFNTVKDSFKIYHLIFGRPIKYSLIAISSFLIDLAIYSTLSKTASDTGEIIFSITAARIFSSLFNYVLNYTVAFSSNESHIKAFLKYYGLVAVNLVISNLVITNILNIVGYSYRIIIKILIDMLIFVMNYLIQKKLIFIRKK